MGFDFPDHAVRIVTFRFGQEHQIRDEVDDVTFSDHVRCSWMTPSPDAGMLVQVSVERFLSEFSVLHFVRHEGLLPTP
ncbi:hypothetical protein AX289_30350 [Methylorubrum populi]|nr:hypothetical protein AX289_30350 [Methylorubrum populi]